MATEIENLVVKLSAEVDGFRSEMKSAVTTVADSSKKMSADFEKFAAQSSKNTSFFTQALSTMTGVLASKVLTGAISFLQSQFSNLIDVFKTGIEDANKQEQALTKLSQALASSGSFSKDAVKEFDAFASSVEALTGVSDDAVISAGALIANIGQLSGESLQRATKGAVDLSAALGIDLDSASRLVAKSVNGQTEALMRYGISVEKGKSDSENLANTLKALEGRFGGAAEALAGTFQGSLRLASAGFGNLAEEISRSVQGNVTIIAVAKEVAKVFNTNAESAQNNRKALREFVGEGVVFAIQGLQGLVEVIDFVRIAWSTLSASVNTAVDAIQTTINALIIKITALGEAAMKVASGDFKGAMQSIKDGTSDAAAEIGFFADRTKTEFEKVNEVNPVIERMRDTLGQIKGAADLGLQATREGMEAMIEPTNQATQAVVALSAETQKLIDQAKERAAVQEVQAEFGDGTDPATAATLVGIEQRQIALDEEVAKNLLRIEDYNVATLELEAQRIEAEKKLKDEQKKADEKREKEKADAIKGTLSALATFQGSKSKELGAIAKAAAIAQATVDTYAAANKALASSPPPFNYVQAAAVTAAGIANVSKIASTPLQGGIDEVPGIGTRDNFPAVLAPGERVVPRETNKDLKEFLEKGAQPSVNVTIQVQGDFFESEDANQRLLERIQRGILQTGFRLVT